MIYLNYKILDNSILLSNGKFLYKDIEYILNECGCCGHPFFDKVKKEFCDKTCIQLCRGK